MDESQENAVNRIHQIVNHLTDTEAECIYHENINKDKIISLNIII